jgi:hypothetical protein
MKTTKQQLDDYFEQLKASIPSSDKRTVPHKPTTEEKLVDLIKQSLTVIEAVYLQSPESFTLARVEEYQRIIRDLETMGYDYKAHHALIERAATGAILAARLPMQKAKGSRKQGGEESQSKAG